MSWIQLAPVRCKRGSYFLALRFELSHTWHRWDVGEYVEVLHAVVQYRFHMTHIDMFLAGRNCIWEHDFPFVFACVLEGHLAHLHREWKRHMSSRQRKKLSLSAFQPPNELHLPRTDSQQLIVHQFSNNKNIQLLWDNSTICRWRLSATWVVFRNNRDKGTVGFA